MPVLPTDTVTVRAEAIADAAVAVTVTVVADAPSPTLDGAAERVRSGYTSLSVSTKDVPVTVLPLSLLPVTETVSSPSTRVSCTGATSNQAWAVAWPFGILIVPTFDTV